MLMISAGRGQIRIIHADVILLQHPADAIDTRGKGNVFRTHVITAPAPHAHLSSEAQGEIINFMQRFKAHTRAVIFTKTVPACQIGVAVHMAGGPDAPSFPRTLILIVIEIIRGEAGATDTTDSTKATGDTAPGILFPHRVREESPLADCPRQRLAIGKLDRNRRLPARIPGVKEPA